MDAQTKAVADPNHEAELQRIVALLGGDRVLLHRLRTPLDAHEMLLIGLPGRALTHLIDSVAVLRNAASLEKAVGISLRTLQRRKDAPAKPLTQEQSGRTWKFAGILAKATAALGSQDEAERWLERPAIGLDQRRPLDLLATPAGMQLVEDFLQRLKVRRLRLTPLPLGGTDLVAWRLDQDRFRPTWDSGEGAFRVGGRWNSRGVRAVYCSIDPAAAILEVVVHKGFRALDTVPHVLTAMTVTDATSVRVVDPTEVPNPNWLRPGIPDAGQQAFGDALLARHGFVLIPSVISTQSWNLLFVAAMASGMYTLRSQEQFALDTELHPPG